MGNTSMSLWGRKAQPSPAATMQKMVANATQELLMGPDVSANLAVSDQLAQEPASCASFVKAVIARLRHGAAHVQLLSLRLVDFCMKNVDDLQLPRAVASKELMQILATLATGKAPRRGFFQFRCAPVEGGRRQEEVHELARVLLRSWAEGFTAVEAEVPMFSQVYTGLIKAGVGFPELRTEEQTNFKLSTQAATAEEAELGMIMRRVQLFSDVLRAAEGGVQGDEMVSELCLELEQTRNDLQTRMPGVEDEQALVGYLTGLNAIETALQEYSQQIEGSSTPTGSAVCEQDEDQTPTSAAAQSQKDSQLHEYASECSHTKANQTPTSNDLEQLLGLAGDPRLNNLFQEPTLVQMPNSNASLSTLQSG